MLFYILKMITVKEVRSFQRNVKKAWNKLEEMFTKHAKSVLHLILNKVLTLPKKTYTMGFRTKWKDAESGKGATSMNFKYLQRIYFSFINSNNNYANIPWASTNKTKLKKPVGKQKQAAHIIFNQGQFTHTCPLLQTLNSSNVYQINLMQMLLFMHRLRTNSFPWIFLHQSQTINHKYVTLYSRNNFKQPKRHANYAKYCIKARGPIMCNSFLRVTKKNILPQQFFKFTIKEKIFEFEEELSFS